MFLAAEAELLRDLVVAARVSVVEVIQQTTALANHHQQTTARAMIFVVFLEMISEFVDALSQQRDLNIRRSGVLFVESEIFYDIRSFH